MSKSLSVVIVAAGSSTRMGFDKLTALIRGQSVLARSIAAFQECDCVDRIVLVCAESRVEEFCTLAEPYYKVSRVVPGGQERKDSVFQGLINLDGNDFVAVHDAARPLVTPAMITRCFQAAQKIGAAACGEPATDTMHRVDVRGVATVTVPRDNLWRMQTPQIGRRIELLEALSQPEFFTDEVSALVAAGKDVEIVSAGRRNFKITFPGDLLLAEAILDLPDF